MRLCFDLLTGLFVSPSLLMLTLFSSTISAAESRALSLTEVIRLSASVAAVDLARLDAAIAQAGYGFEKSTMRPQVDAVAGWTRQRLYLQTDNVPYSLTPDNTVDARLRVGQALIDLEIWNRVHAAARRMEAAEAATTSSLEESAAQAAATYAALASAEAFHEVRTQDLKLAEELLTLAKAQVAAGASEGIAVTRAETRVAAAQTGLTAADGSRRSNSIALARALRLDTGVPISASEHLSETMGSSLAPTTSTEAVISALKARPELQVSGSVLAALEADVRAARGARLPTVDAFADAGRIGPTADDTTTTWRMGLEVRLPILNGQSSVVDAARLRTEQQVILNADLRERIMAEVRTAIVTLETGLAGLASANNEQRLSEQEVSEARKRFAAGVAGNLEVIDAQRSLATARDRVVTAMSIVVQARIGLGRAVGVATTLR